MSDGKKLVLYHIPGFRSSRPVWMYHELEKIYAGRRPGFPELELKIMDKATFRTQKPAEFLALNPNGKIPVLVDGDTVMFDGCAICNYLLER